jgi:hypothetical protein
MFKNNSQNSSKFKGSNPLPLSCNLKGKCPAIGNYSYTKRCALLKRTNNNRIIIEQFLILMVNGNE